MGFAASVVVGAAEGYPSVVVGFAASAVVGAAEEFTVAVAVAVAVASSAVAVAVTVTAGCNVVDLFFSSIVLTAYTMTARRSLSSIFPSKALRPWSIPFLYSAGFFSLSVFERFAPSFGVVVFDLFLL